MPSRGICRRASGRRYGEIGWIVATSATLYPAVTVLQVVEAGAVGGGCLLESTPSMGVEDGVGVGVGSTALAPATKIRHFIPSGGRGHLDDGSRRHSS